MRLAVIEPLVLAAMIASGGSMIDQAGAALSVRDIVVR